MTTIISEVYDAFKLAGVDDEKAKAAAAAVISVEQAATKADINALEARIYRAMGAQTFLLIMTMIGLKIFG